MAIDVAELVKAMQDAATQVLKKDVTTLRGFSERQLKAIAQQTVFIESGIKSGGITDETRDFFLDSLEDMVLNFVKTLRGLMLVTIEKVWNSIVGVLWKTLEASTGIHLANPEMD